MQGALRGEAPLLLEIFAALFEGVSAKTLLDAATTQPAALPLAEPAVARKGPLQQKATQRHPRFGGMFIRRLEGGSAQCAVGTIQHQDLLGAVVAANKSVRPVRCLLSMTRRRVCLKASDACARTTAFMSPANVQAVKDRPVQLEGEVLLQLRSYAEAFLEGSYNILLGSVRKDLEPGLNISRLSADDFLRFFRLSSFFTAFVRMQQACNWIAFHLASCNAPPNMHALTPCPSCPTPEQETHKKRRQKGEGSEAQEESPFSCISATMGWETFHLVQSLWLSTIDLPAAAQTGSGDKWELQVSPACCMQAASRSTVGKAVQPV